MLRTLWRPRECRAAGELIADGWVDPANRSAALERATVGGTGQSLDRPTDREQDRASRALELAKTAPTLLPDLLRSLSNQANRLATDPLNPLDNNPFITREWLVVSQVLHRAAGDMEKRFAALFLGS
jgi:hypothetical protein